MRFNCTEKNPLIRDGSGRKNRRLAALSPDFIGIDERKLPDLLEWAKNFAGELQYYNIENEPDGDWKAFFENDISAIISEISLNNPDDIKTCHDDIITITENNDSNNTELKPALYSYFVLLFYIAYKFDGWFKNSIKELKVYDELQKIITSRLKSSFNKIISLYKYASDNSILADTLISSAPSVINISDINSLFTYSFDRLWITGDNNYTGWRAYYDSIEKYQDDTAVSDTEKIQSTVEELNQHYEVFINSYSKIILQSSDFLEESLTSYSGHEPHMTLFLAFLRLFKYAQDNINLLTASHLDYYYQTVLGIKTKDAEPNHVNVIFTLAKQVSAYKIAAGKILLAGKDATGVEIFYKTDREIAVNKATINEIKNVYIDYDDDRKGKIYAAPIANSGDGNGSALDKDNPKWKTFGESHKDKTGPELTTLYTDFGFAIASPLLLLNEGYRTITITLALSGLSGFGSGSYDDMFLCTLSGKKNWIDPSTTTTTAVTIDETSSQITIALTLTADADPVINYNAGNLGYAFKTGYPVLLVLLNEESALYDYKSLKDAVLDSITIDVDVVGVKNLVLQNDTGLLNPDKPFFPFGNFPVLNSAFYIGSQEIFQKPLTSFKATVEWMNLPAEGIGNHYQYYPDDLYIIKDSSLDSVSSPELGKSEQDALKSAIIRSELLGKKYSTKAELKKDLLQTMDIDSATGESKTFTRIGVNVMSAIMSNAISNSQIIPPNDSFKVKFSLLNNRAWSEPGSEQPLFDNGAEKTLIVSTFNSFDTGIIEDSLTGYTSSLNRGFIKMELSAPGFAFGHSKFRDIYSKAIIDYAKDSTDDHIPKEPYTPLIKTITVDYEAQETINLNGEIEDHYCQFYHITPFGFNDVSSKTNVPVVPQFQTLDKGTNKPSNAELYLGISGLVPPQSLSVLFQVAEGSANPELNKETIYWSYLSNNEWIPFEEKDIPFDSTDGLINSGIVSFNIPADADKTNIILPSGKHWIKCSILKDTDAVCDIIDIQTQAVQATFSDNNNDPDFLASDLPAGKVAKLSPADSSVKGVSQPYASSGGRIKEQGEDYYLRVSERLRHKQRGISLWDYERIILEKFPSIYKVKCINHSTYHYDDGVIDIPKSEFAPGYVTLIIIPDVTNKNAVNPLEPKASLATLTEIKKEISKYISPFAAKKIKVINPLYERIQVEFNVVFFEDYDEGLYKVQLNTDIKKFLSPWAYKDGEDINFGGSIHKSVILNFIEKCYYVDYVTDFKMHQFLDEDEENPDKLNIEEAIPSSSRSILVSHSGHLINQNKT